MSHWLNWIDTSLPWRHPSVIPPGAGWYVRDWRGTRVIPEEERVCCIDLWTPLRDPGDILYPGIWYVVPGLNDASEERLPWRFPTGRELATFAALYPNEYRSSLAGPCASTSPRASRSGALSS